MQSYVAHVRLTFLLFLAHLVPLVAAEVDRAAYLEKQMTNPEALAIARTYPDSCEVTPPAAAGTELRYYPPFSPTDSVFDVWCKLQTLKAKGAIRVWLVTDEHSTPMVKSNFPLDGTAQSTRRMFAYDLVNAIQTGGGVYLNRAVSQLSEFGFPERTPEGQYRFYKGELRIELSGVEILGMDFDVIATFPMHANVIPEHFKGTGDYLHIPLITRASDTKPQLIGFPWALGSVFLSSKDKRVAVAAPSIKKSILDKYAKWVTKKDEVVQSRGSASGRNRTSRVSEVTDGTLLIGFEEGSYEANNGTDNFLYISYLPARKGRFDISQRTDYVDFRNAVVARSNKEVLDGLKSAPKKNPDPF